LMIFFFFFAFVFLPLVAESQEAVSQELDFELLTACAEGKAEEVERLLGAGASAAFATEDGETPLHLAGLGGSPAVVRLLVEAGGDVDARVTSPKGLFMTPLTWMTYGAHVEGARTLLELGATPDLVVVDEVGTRLTALDIAVHRVQDHGIADVIRAHGGRHFDDIPERDLSAVMMPEKDANRPSRTSTDFPRKDPADL